MTIEITRISATQTEVAFQILNYSTYSDDCYVTLRDPRNVIVYSNTVALPAYDAVTMFVTGLTPGTTYVIGASLDNYPDIDTKIFTTEGTPPPKEYEYWGSEWGANAWGGMSVSEITTTNEQISGAVNIAKAYTDNIVGSVMIRSVVPKDITGAVRISKNLTKTISGSVDVKKTLSKDITGVVAISSPFYNEISGAVTIYNPNERVSYANIDGVVRINKTSEDNIDGCVRIAEEGSNTISGAVTIWKEETTDISGLVRIIGLNNAEISGKTRIRVAVPEKLPEEWEYSGVAEADEWEKVDKTDTGWTEVDKTDEDWGEVEKDSTDWSKASDTEALEWNYPLEDSG